MLTSPPAPQAAHREAMKAVWGGAWFKSTRAAKGPRLSAIVVIALNLWEPSKMGQVLVRNFDDDVLGALRGERNGAAIPSSTSCASS